ncbi:hypothetical protein C1S80_29975 [Mycolicibacterium aubagnense]|nr:hypothetical protein C1S80_29975 [Mycolicibacterium aubagnense]
MTACGSSVLAEIYSRDDESIGFDDAAGDHDLVVRDTADGLTTIWTLNQPVAACASASEPSSRDRFTVTYSSHEPNLILLICGGQRRRHDCVICNCAHVRFASLYAPE